MASQLYTSALNGELESPDSTGQTAISSLTITNKISVGIDVNFIDTTGEFVPIIYGLKPGATSPAITGLYSAAYLIAFTSYSGSFVGVLELQAATSSWVLDSTFLMDPNDIGDRPTATAEVPIPPSSPRVLVASGQALNGSPIIREQYWQRGADSFMLAPSETRTVSYAVTSGIQETTSEQHVLATALGLSTTAGWGPISASFSANLSTQSTTFQQVDIYTESTRYESTTLQNLSNTDPMYILKWQLTDIVTVFDQTSAFPLGAIVYVASPEIIDTADVSAATVQSNIARRRRVRPVPPNERGKSLRSRVAADPPVRQTS